VVRLPAVAVVAAAVVAAVTPKLLATTCPSLHF
jgi:hypothetical protein